MIDDTIRKMIQEEIVAYMQGGQAQPAPVAAPPVAAPPVAAPPVAAPPVAAPPVAAPPVAAPPVAAPPVAAPPVAAPPVPPTVPVAGPPLAPVAQPPVSAPMTGVPTLDEIRALANDFARAKPQDMHLFAAFMAGKGVDSLANMPPDQYPACKAELQRLIGA